jgi:hypothetical protein
MRRQAPKGETLALLGHNHHPMSKTLPLLGLLQPATRAQKPSTLPHAPEIVQLPWWRPVIKVQRPICKGADPHRPGLCQNVQMRASFFFSVQGLVTTLSCLCHPNVHLMGSSAPWRSELIISPCAPILWYLSAGHGPAHQRLRPPGAHQS